MMQINVRISHNGFHPQKVTLEEGQSVIFEWDKKTTQNITQVIHTGQTFTSVVEGYDLQMPPDRSLVLPFNLEGEYIFSLNDTRDQLLIITVHAKQDYIVEVTNDGFQPDIIRINKGTSVKWKWNQCVVRHTVQEVLYCIRHSNFYAKSQIPEMGSLTGHHRQQFKKPGVYYFRTESSDFNKLHYCAIVVSDMKCEYRINVLDNMFQPSILVIEEEEVVWWSWSPDLCENSHAIFQVKLPGLNSSIHQPYEPEEDGFMWNQPSRQGLIAHKFKKPGVYYYSDKSEQCSANIIGTIIVKSRPKDHHIKINNQSGFICDLLRLETNDRIWWNWIERHNQITSFCELDRSINPIIKHSLQCCSDKTEDMDEESKKILNKVGLICVCITTIGVYSYSVACTQDTISCCTVIATPAPKNHTIHISEGGYEKPAITIRPDDYVWWLWQNEKLPHNIVQVNYAYEHIPGGFNSGSVRESPSAFMHQFHTPGTYYYMSFPIKKIGVIQVATQTQVHEISVNTDVIRPDPLVIHVNDIVFWVFDHAKSYSLHQVNNLNRIISSEIKDEQMKRRCIAKVFEDTGIFHFNAKSLGLEGSKPAEPALSTVIVDPDTDSSVVYVDNKGFHPQTIVLEKGQQVVWKWTELHNIVHVSLSLEAETFGIVKGKHSFNSGKAIANGQFCHNFYDLGEYTVISEKALDYSGRVIIIENAPKLEMAHFEDYSKDKDISLGDTIKLFHSLIGNPNYDLKLIYTIDGTYPHPYNESTMMYDDECGISFQQRGMHIIRVQAYCQGFQCSNVLNSQRFHFFPPVNPDSRSTISRTRMVDDISGNGPTETLWKLWSTEPCIHLEPLKPGEVHLYWNKLSEEYFEIISGYQLFVNNQQYGALISPSTHSLHVSGLAAGKKYSLYVTVIAKSPGVKPVASNTLVFQCPISTSRNGPLISLGIRSSDNSLVIRWAPLKFPEIAYYQVYQNDVKCISKILQPNDNRPMSVDLKVGESNVLSSIYVEAIPKIDESEDIDYSMWPITSNVLHIKMTDIEKYLKNLTSNEETNSSEPFLEFITVKENPNISSYSQSSESSSSIMSSDSSSSESLSISEIRCDKNDEASHQISLTDSLNKQPNTIFSQIHNPHETTFFSENAKIPFEESKSLDENSTDIKEMGSAIKEVSPVKGSALHDNLSNGNTPPVCEDVPIVKTSSMDSPTGKEELSPNDEVSPSKAVPSPITEALPAKEMPISLSETLPTKEVFTASSDTLPAKETSPSTSDKAESSTISDILPAEEDSSTISDILASEEVPSVYLLLNIEDHSEDNAVLLMWKESASVQSNYQAKIFTVTVSGTNFLPNIINSNVSYECNIMINGSPTQGIVHCWNVTKENSCKILGLCPGSTYNFSVSGTYSNGNKNMSIKSPEKVFVMRGLLGPPVLTSFKVDLYKVSFCIEEPEYLPPNHKLTAYKVSYGSSDDEEVIDLSDSRIEKELKPGSTVTITATAISEQDLENSKPCLPIHVSCPLSPLAPAIEQQTSFKKDSILISWSKPSASSSQDITMYRIYLDGKLTGEIQANSYSDKKGYQYTFTGPSVDRISEVFVKSVCGKSQVEPGNKYITVLSDSPPSNILTVCSAKGFTSPKLYLEGMTPDGIDVAWEIPEQNHFDIVGYQMFKNHILYGSIIPPEINALCIRDLTLGDEVTLQLVALTKTQISKPLNKQNTDEEDEDNINSEIKESIENHKYSSCEPGPLLNLQYTGLVQSPSKVWCEKVTGHSALIVWNKDEEIKSHYLQPEKYQLTWWPGAHAEKGIVTDYTENDHFVVTNLQPNTYYTVIVEARSMKKISNETSEDGEESMFILSTKSEPINVKTARPPSPPSNIGVVSSTCNSVKLAWNPPREHGVEITGLYLELTSVTKNKHDVIEHQTHQLRPDSKEAIFENLAEMGEYLLRIYAVNDEYFDLLPVNNPFKKLCYIPEGTNMRSVDSMWLPYSSLVFKTSGTDPATNLTISHCTTTTLTVTWTNAVIHGTNEIEGIAVRWVQVEEETCNKKELPIGHLAKLPKDANYFVIKDLSPGCHYCITVDTMVYLKTSLDADNYENAWRTVCVSSQPLVASTHISIPTPTIHVSGYKDSMVNLFWEIPRTSLIVGKNKNGEELYQKYHLLGYQLLVNDLLHATLRPEDTHCTLQKCKPGKNYCVTLVVMSSHQKDNKVKKWKCHPKNLPNSCWPATAAQNNGIEYTPSDPLNIKLPAKSKGSITSIRAKYEESEEIDSPGDILLEWCVNSPQSVTQFVISWVVIDDKVTVMKSLLVDKLHCSIPVNKLKSMHEITIESQSREDNCETSAQPIHIMSPGEPDAPFLLLDSVTSSVISLCWQHPRTYGSVTIKAYQLYVNDNPTVDIANDITAYDYSCSPEKVYKFNLVAVSNNCLYRDSARSNSLVVTSPSNKDNDWRKVGQRLMFPGDSKNIPNYLKASRVTDMKIHLEWTSHVAPEGLASYRIQWSSVAQPEVREVNLLRSETKCILSKCLPGVIHYIRLNSIGRDDSVLDESHYLIVQTSAPPNMPVVILRSFNFQHICIEWNKPVEYGEAKINGYLIFINDILESNVPPDQTTYTFTEGEWCKEYIFQVQALTDFEWLSSKISDPLAVQWPGIVAPVLRRDPPFESELNISWDKPYLTPGIKVKYFKITCLDCSSGDIIQTLGPILPHINSVKFDYLKAGIYSVRLKIYIFHTPKVISSEPMEVILSALVSPPFIKVNILGKRKRQMLEKITCQLLNARDKLTSKYNLRHQVSRNSLTRKSRNNHETLVQKTLLKLENLLQHYITALSHYTGEIHLDISWEYIQTEPDVKVSGYQLLLDGENFGSLISGTCTTFQTTVKADNCSHTLSMVAQTEDSPIPSKESNSIHLETSQFQPFTYYCYCKGHINGAKWPSPGCCQFVDAFNQEHQLHKKLPNLGVIKHSPQLPICSLKNQINNYFEPVLPSPGAICPTLILFWLPWCSPCQKVMTFLQKFVQEYPDMFTYLCINCDTQSNPEDYSGSVIQENRWNKETPMKHYSSHMILENPQPEDRSTENKDLRKYLGIEGVPTILLADNMGFMKWIGRFCAPNFKLFASFLQHALHQVKSTNKKNCIHCEVEYSQESDIDFIQQLIKESDSLLEKLCQHKLSSLGTKTKKMLFKRRNSNQSYYSFEEDLNYQEDQLIDLNTSNNEQ